MVSCLIQEWETLREQYTLPPPVTIFFGGGTPSLLETKYVEMLTSRIAASSRSCLEVSLEANPGDLIGKVESLKNAGVTRLSIGAQALNDRDLKFLNRNHNVVQIWKSLEESHKVFPRSTSADLIFGRPGQSSDNFLSELRQLSSAGLAHVSLYQLTVERGTRLHRQVASGQVQLPGEEEMADMYSGALATLAAAGLARYEVSNFSVAGAECLHNLGYWSGRQYLGLGPGAHSRVGRGQQRVALVTTPHPDSWMREVEARGEGVRTSRPLDTRARLQELLVTGLRTEAGICEADWARARGRGGLSLAQLAASLLRQTTGFLWTGGRLRLSPDKICILDSILPDALNVLDEIYT